MKINADQSGNYILITDIHRRVVYCLECYTSFEDEGSCYIRSVNVCFIESPVLSFIISTVKEGFITVILSQLYPFHDNNHVHENLEPCIHKIKEKKFTKG